MSTRTPFQFGLSSMLLITTLVAVIMSVSVMVPGIGIALAIVSVPALLRTYVLVRRKRENGETVTNQDKALLFVLCLGIALLIAIAAGAAFFVPCLAGAFSCNAVSKHGDGIFVGAMIGAIAGLIASLTVLIYVLRKWFSHSSEKRTIDEVPKSLREYLDNPLDEEPILLEPVPPEPRADSPPILPGAQPPEPTTKSPDNAIP